MKEIAAILQLSDELEPLDVVRPIERDAPPQRRRRERTLRLVEADRAARHAGDRGEVVDRAFVRQTVAV